MRKRIENNVSEAKIGTLECAGARYSFGKNKMRAIGEDAGAIIKIGKSVRVNFTILDKYMNSLSGE